MPNPVDALATCRFTGTWRHYQRLALDAFERDRSTGDHRFYAVLPPGAGKTLVGLEVARRLGHRVLILTPNTAVQGQWASAWNEMFAASASTPPRCGTDRRLRTAVNVLTYQSIAVLDGGDAAQRRAAARADESDALLNLLHPNGRAVIEMARELGPWTLVMDECHHLLATWGALVRAVVNALGPGTALIGLTATPPRHLNGWQRALHDDLFSTTDIEVPTPALVRSGTLAPYQELVYLTRPTPDEDTWLASETARFADLRLRLVDERLGSLPLLAWLDRRVTQRRSQAGARQSWAAFEQAEPALARAGLRFAHARLIALPEGARIREQHRTVPNADDWVTVLADFCTGHLIGSDDPRDRKALAAVKRVLPSLGYRLTVRGLQAAGSPVDRLCGLSEAKVAAAVHILEVEHDALGTRLRGLVLCDFEQLSGRLPASLVDTPLDRQSGSARLAFATLATADVGGVGGLRPLLVTGQTFACPTTMADEVVAYCRRAGYQAATEPLPDAPDTTRIVGPTNLHARVWVRLATELLTTGRARVLVGTRALLGEGWDCPALNVSVDLTTATTTTAVAQMRGRSLRLDTANPDKVADNWTVCCGTDDHPRGDADYLRLARKHDAYFALTATGEIESGLTHCDPALSPFAMPSVPDARAITARALARAGQRAAAGVAWRVGEPFAGTELATLRVRAARPLGTAARALPDTILRPAPPGQSGSSPRSGPPVVVAGAVLVTGVVVGLIAGPAAGLLTGLTLVLVALGVLGAAAVRRCSRLVAAPTALEQLAAAVADAIHSAGGADAGAEAVRIVPTPDGWLRCELTGLPPDQSQRFATVLDEVLAPLAEPRHLVGRRVLHLPSSRPGRLALAVRSLLRLPVPGAVVWHAVPRWCAANHRRLRAFLDAWHRHVGPPRHLSADSPEGHAVLDLFRGEDPFAVTSQLRTLWR